jgi:hypothetical protein
MIGRVCNLRAATDQACRNARFARFDVNLDAQRNSPRSRGQSRVRISLPGFHVLLPLLLALTLWNGCALPGSPGDRTGVEAAPREPALDAVLPYSAGTTTANWRVLRLPERLHVRLSPDSTVWVNGRPQIAPAAWRKLAAPSGPFRPVQAVPGLRGYFHLVDAASGRLCLYDADASLISTFALPAEFTPFPTGRVAVFRGADGAFTFLDYASGEARQYADRQTVDVGSTGWFPRGKTRLPSGLRDCIQPAGSAELFCYGADGGALRFDGALNRVPAWNASDVTAAGWQRAVWNPASARWDLWGFTRATDSLANPLYILDPASRNWRTFLPDSGTAAPPIYPSSEP